MWSSCPWVKRYPRIFSRFPIRYVMSGITRSTPSISSLGKTLPQSTTMMSSSYSNTYMFLPISSTPPRDTIRRRPVSFCCIFVLTFAAFHLRPCIAVQQEKAQISPCKLLPCLYEAHTCNHDITLFIILPPCSFIKLLRKGKFCKKRTVSSETVPLVPVLQPKESSSALSGTQTRRYCCVVSS